MFLTTNSVMACSPGYSHITVLCLNGQNVSDFRDNTTSSFIATLPPSCILGTDKDALIHVWQQNGRFMTGDIYIIPAAITEEQFRRRSWDAAQTGGYLLNGSESFIAAATEPERYAPQQLLTCRYIKRDTFGDWLFLGYARRSYCPEVENLWGGSLCPETRFSLTEFGLYVVTHVTRETIPYLILGAMLMLGVLVDIRTKFQRGHLGRAFRPNVITLGTAVMITLLAWFWGTAHLGDLVFISIAGYYLVSKGWYHAFR
jgi:hypothetical protein